MAPWDVGLGWEGEGWDGEFGMQGNWYEDRNPDYNDLPWAERKAHKRHIHPYLRGGFEGKMPFDLPGDYRFDAGLTIDPDNNFRDSDFGGQITWNPFGGSGAGNTGYM
tara:strand:+ start:533 stop:856 length:324 start_codon:yes stop_codon:yes gene_type:complete